MTDQELDMMFAEARLRIHLHIDHIWHIYELNRMREEYGIQPIYTTNPTLPFTMYKNEESRYTYGIDPCEKDEFKRKYPLTTDECFKIENQ